MPYAPRYDYVAPAQATIATFSCAKNWRDGPRLRGFLEQK
jgi:hypothetical protein